MLTYWEQQFSLRKVLPDFQDWLDRMAQDSADVSPALELSQHAYGPDPRQWVELSGTPDAVLPVFIHGGYWRGLEAETHRFVLPTLKQMAGVVANVEYRLLPHVRLAEIVADVCAALRLIADLSGAPLYVVGHSAGGHLAVMGALQEPEIVVGACALSGLFDLEPLPLSFLAEEVGLTTHDVADLSPLHLWQGRADHITAAVGAEETPEFLRQTHHFAAQHGAKWLEVEGAHHMSVLGALARPEGTVARAIAHEMERLGP